MKQQNLNTVIKDGLSNGEGLPYKDEYWNKMDDLLSKNMPSNETQYTVTKVAKVSRGLQLTAALSIATSIAVITYYTVFSTSNSSTQPKIQQPNNQTHLASEHPTIDNHSITNSTSDKASDKQEKNTVEQTNNVSSNSSAANPTVQLEQTTHTKPTSLKSPIDNSINKEIYEKSKGNKSRQSPLFIDNTPIINTQTTVDNTPAIRQNQYSNTEETQNTEGLITKTVDFNLIEPAQSNRMEIKVSNNQNQPSLLKHPNRHRIIQHASISPFAGVTYKNREQTYTSEGIIYTNPKQTHFVSGINLQLESKYFALRTGLGISTTQLNSSFETLENKYTSDTNYIIVNSAYQTTLSGKPIALIRQQIDSSITFSQEHLHKGAAEYTYLIIPLTIQYRMAHKRCSFFIEGGTLHNVILTTQSNGSFLSASSDTKVLIPKYTLQFTGGTGIGYALNSKYTLEAQYNYALLGKHTSSPVNWLNNAHLFTIMLTRNLW